MIPLAAFFLSVFGCWPALFLCFLSRSYCPSLLLFICEGDRGIFLPHSCFFNGSLGLTVFPLLWTSALLDAQGVKAVPDANFSLPLYPSKGDSCVPNKLLIRIAPDACFCSYRIGIGCLASVNFLGRVDVPAFSFSSFVLFFGTSPSAPRILTRARAPVTNPTSRSRAAPPFCIPSAA